MRAAGQIYQDNMSDESPIGLEVYSSDGQLIGRIQGYLQEVEETAEDAESGAVDLVNQEGDVIRPRRVLIDGHGYVTQAQIAIPLDQMQLDFAGRRATVPMTLAQIERIPHRDPANADAPPTA